MDKNFITKWFTKNVTVERDYCDPEIGWGIRYIDSEQGSAGAKETVSYNQDFVFACVQKIQQYISSIPLHLYAWTDNPEKMITPHTVVTKAFKNSIKNDPRIAKKSMEMVEIDDHNLIEFFKYPAENMSYADWISTIAAYYLFCGNVLLEKVYDGQTLKYLNVLKWEMVTPMIIQGKIIRYDYNDTNNAQKSFTPDQVIHIRNFSVGNIILGKSVVGACLNSAKLYKWFDEYQITLSKNYGMPGVMINVKNKVSNAEEAEKISQKFMMKYGGGGNGKPMVAFGDVQVTDLSVTPKDMEYTQGRKAAMKVICSTLGVPIDLVDVEDSNRASSITALNSFRQITIFPLLSKILDQINSQFVRNVDANAFVWFNSQEMMDNDPVAQADMLSKYVSGGIMSVNEARKIIGLEPIHDTTETGEQTSDE